MKAVNTRVSNITVTREKYNMKASWVVPDEMIDRDNDRCAQWVDSRMEFWIKGKQAADHVEAQNKYQKGVGNPNPDALDISFTGADFFWIRGQGTGSEVIKNFSRTRYYPHTTRKCEKVRVGAWGGNAKGNGIKLWTQYTFGLPRKPQITWSLDEQTKVATVTVKTDPGEDKHERYDTRIIVDFLAPGGSAYQAFSTNASYKGWFSTTSTEFTLSRDMSSFMSSLTNDKPIKLRCRAFARGILGDNPKVNETGKDKESPVTKEMVIAIPTPATIDKIEVDKKNKNGEPLTTSRITVSITCGKNTSSVKLQRRVGESGNFSDVSGAVDNGNCKALYDSYGNVLPEKGQHVYYRIESEKFGLPAHSAPKRADCLFVAKPKVQCLASLEILKISQYQRTYNGNVEGVLSVVMAYTDNTNTNSGCELSWSEYPNAWNSNTEPTVERFTENDSAETTKGYTKKYKHTKTVTLYGFTPGTRYYLRMRRYRTVDGTDYYSSYDTTLGNRKSVLINAAGSGDTCGIVSAEINKALGKATLVIGVTENNANTGTEVSWSTDENAWWSNEQPSTLEATWSLSNASGAAAQNWTKQQTVYLMGLELGKSYYVRARRYLDSSNGRTYGPYAKTFSFTLDSSAVSASIQCNLLSVEPTSGTSAVAVVGWDGDHTGCEVSWSKDPNAWESTETPRSFEFDWQDKWNKSGFKTEDASIDSAKTYYTRTGQGTDSSPYKYAKVASPVAANLGSYYELPWSHTSTCYISDLEEGETYYVKARSYYDGGSDKAWSDYSDPLVVIPFGAPNDVVLDAPDTVVDADGSSLEFFWSVDSEMPQTEWNVYQSDVSPDKLIHSGTGSLCRASLPDWRFRGLESISFYVEAACGGGFTRSNVETVKVVKQPECHATVEPVLVEQPATFEVYADRADVSVLATCRSEGITVTLPNRDVEQVGGDVVWTASSSPAFEETTWGETAYRQRLSDAVDDAQDAVDEAQAVVDGMESDDPMLEIAQNALAAANAKLTSATAARDADLADHPSDGAVYAATVSMPVVDLYDGGSYILSVQTTESVAKLASEVVELPFSVDYSHKAFTPPNGITVTPDISARAARIELAEPTDVTPAEDDVYDVYRKTQDGYDLISSNVPIGGSVYDNFAPFGNVELAYRVCCRTADGSIAFRDFPYTMDVRGTRFDWDNKSVELPWNVETSDSYAKSFEARSHVDGSVNGYYDKAVVRTGSLSTDTVKVREQGTLELVRALGNYPGACFCRTDKGAAFQCNAELSSVGVSYKNCAVPVRFELTKMDLSQEFMVKDEEDVDNG